jgi:hypothetical protein
LEILQKYHKTRDFKSTGTAETLSAVSTARNANERGQEIGTYSRESILQKTQAHNGCYRRDHNWTDESATKHNKKRAKYKAGYSKLQYVSEDQTKARKNS